MRRVKAGEPLPEPRPRKYHHLTLIVRKGRKATILYRPPREPGQPRPNPIQCSTDDWDEAAAVRDEYEGRATQAGVGILFADAARHLCEVEFGDANQRYEHTTKRMRKIELREDGPMLEFFGSHPLSAIGPGLVFEWYETQITQRGRSRKTGRNRLDVLSHVFHSAKLRGAFDGKNPVNEMRELLKERRARTKADVAESKQAREKHPVESAEDLSALVNAMRAEGPRAYAFLLLQLDAGMRLSEARGLKWKYVVPEKRRILVEEIWPQDGKPGTLPKEAERRWVEMSHRLEEVIHLIRSADPFGAKGNHHLFGDKWGDLNTHRFRDREWRRVIERAGIGPYQMRDLRSTYATQLLSAGIPLGRVSKRLGHADMSMTAKHYAKWVESDDEDYREPMVLAEGEIPADLLARIGYALGTLGQDAGKKSEVIQLDRS